MSLCCVVERLMGKENEATAMEIDGPKFINSDKINPRYSINGYSLSTGILVFQFFSPVFDKNKNIN